MTSLRVLLVEDDEPYADLFGGLLRDELGADVSSVYGPRPAAACLREEAFDVVVVDMRYKGEAEAFAMRRDDGQVLVNDDREFLLSGLSIIQAARSYGRRPADAGANPAIVLWSIAEDNRRLHLKFAYEMLGVRAFCTKGSGFRPGDNRSPLGEAVLRAAAGESYVDNQARAYLPAREAAGLGTSLFAKSTWRSIWRSLALKRSDRASIKAPIFHSQSTVNKALVEMRDALERFDPGLPRGREPLPQLIAYADRNWEFFLDDAVMRTFPPDEARGLQ